MWDDLVPSCICKHTQTRNWRGEHSTFRRLQNLSAELEALDLVTLVSASAG